MSDTQIPASSGDEPYDEETQFEESQQIVTNDAVAGETVLPGLGDGNDGPTGGSPREAEPRLADNDLDNQDVDLDETE
ncbi:hypothetical protein [Frigoribacterium faeni]|uniref:hypothetical protein n=1 Tax=Frigoribacterium faeni TaxID=145483 RepID=UPI00141B7C4B|nr:hypothetical protein [Frigoribacterium faeni]NIJ05212.1 hypothetical protein [Frigoribacterium faeni]